MSSGTGLSERVDPNLVHVRRWRKVLSAFGTLFILIAVYLLFEPTTGLTYVTLGFGAFGAIVVSIAVWGSDRMVVILEFLLTGWP